MSLWCGRSPLWGGHGGSPPLWVRPVRLTGACLVGARPARGVRGASAKREAPRWGLGEDLNPTQVPPSPRAAAPAGACRHRGPLPRMPLVAKRRIPLSCSRGLSPDRCMECPSMAKRHQMSNKGSRSYFSATAARTHRKNNMPSTSQSGPMRGGIRL